MHLYRLGKAARIRDVSGNGGLYYAGRWHTKGTPLLYTSEHLSLAKLEVLANSASLPVNYYALTLEIPPTASVRTVTPQELPPNWMEIPYPQELAEITRAWILAGSTWVLKVPSAQAPSEWNYLLNPLHPEHATLRIVAVAPHSFDTRLK